MVARSAKTLWVITARSGSKSVPHKNIRNLGGYPLLQWRAASALRVAERGSVWISTDSEEYAKHASRIGVQVPFLRPAELATDEARSSDVIMHAMKYAESQGKSYELIGMLEPTSPFVRPESLARAETRLLSDTRATALVATREVRPSSFYVQKESIYLDHIARNIRQHGFKRRQDEETEITPSGGYYLARWDQFLKDPSFYTEWTLSDRVDPIESLEIDEPMDWEWAEFLVTTGKVRASDYGLQENYP